MEDYAAFIRNRITMLRMERSVSEYQMSLDLGQNKNYIQGISSGKAMPSMAQFLNICDYFGITPEEFFHTDTLVPQKVKELVEEIEKLSPRQAEHILEVIKDLGSKR